MTDARRVVGYCLRSGSAARSERAACCSSEREIVASHAGRNDRVFGVVAVLVGLWAMFLAFFRIPVAQVLWDEPIYSLAGWRYIHRDVFAPGEGGSLGEFVDNFEHPPLAKYLFGIGQVVAGGQSITATRVVAAVCGLATAALLGWWVGRHYDRWTGLAVAAVIALAPMVVAPSVVSFRRLGMLDSVAGLLAVATLLLAWQWWERAARDALGWALVTGVAAGLATSAKESGFLVLVGPVLYVLVAAARRGELRRRVVQALTMAVVSVATFVVTYLPLGHPLDRIRYLWDFQTKHSRLGHTVVLDGTTVSHPPWWANLWFAWDGLGTLLVVLLVIGVVAALVVTRDHLVAFCLMGLLGPVVFFFFFAGVALPFYWVMWAPLAITVSVVGWRSVLLLLGRGARGRSWVVPAAAAGLAILAAVPAVASTRTTASLEMVGVMRLPLIMQQEGLRGPILTSNVSDFDKRTYLRGHQLAGTPKEPGNADTVVVGSPKCGVPTDRVTAALVSLNRKWGRIREVYADDQVIVYRSLGTLLPPGYLDVVTIRPPSC